MQKPKTPDFVAGVMLQDDSGDQVIMRTGWVCTEWQDVLTIAQDFPVDKLYITFSLSTLPPLWYPLSDFV